MMAVSDIDRSLEGSGGYVREGSGRDHVHQLNIHMMAGLFRDRVAACCFWSVRGTGLQYPLAGGGDGYVAVGSGGGVSWVG